MQDRKSEGERGREDAVREGKEKVDWMTKRAKERGVDCRAEREKKRGSLDDTNRKEETEGRVDNTDREGKKARGHKQGRREKGRGGRLKDTNREGEREGADLKIQTGNERERG